jgi:hypothetical protein
MPPMKGNKESCILDFERETLIASRKRQSFSDKLIADSLASHPE